MEQPNESQKRKLEEEEAPETEVKAEEPTAKKAKTETSADDKAKVKKQIEYYFSDSNYRRDKWLLEEAAKHPEGYIEIEKIAAFPRLQALTTDLDVVVDVMRSSERLAVSEDGKLVKRAHPLPEVDDSVQRTIFVKGLGGEVSIDAVEAHFKKYGPVTRVSLFREKETKKPKGEAFIEFETQEAAKAATAEEKQDYNGNEVTVKPKMAAREKPQKAERKRKANDEEKEGEEKDNAEEQQKRREERLQRMQGTVLHITLSSDEGQEFNPDFNKWDIKTLVEEVLPTDQIKFVDFSAKQAWVRLDNPDAAQKALAALTETTKEVKGVKFTNPRVLEGGEENQYLEKILEEGDRKFGKKGGRGGGRGGKRGRGGRGGRRGGRSRD